MNPYSFLVLIASAWAVKLFFFWEENLERMLPLQCFFEVVMLYSWLEKQENAFMVNIIP